jgi:hypothetical protein
MRGGDIAVSGREATVTGVYDYWLGGGRHLRADRELGKAIEEEFPSARAHVRAARDFHLRVTRWCAERGIARFIRSGAVTWQPGGSNVHDAAREVNPGAQVVYVNRDAGAHDWARELLADGPGTAAVHAPASHPAEVLGAPPVAALLAPREPVCMIIGMVLHFAAPEAAAAGIAAYAGALPSGSVIAVSVSLPDDSPQAGRLLAMFAPARVHRHTVADVRGWLKGAGLEVVPPGVRDVRLLPGGAWALGELPPRAPGMTAGALGLVS